jgi:hypothetical protein
MQCRPRAASSDRVARSEGGWHSAGAGGIVYGDGYRDQLPRTTTGRRKAFDAVTEFGDGTGDFMPGIPQTCTAMRR